MPTDQDPATIIREGRNAPVNTSQKIPRASKEIKKFSEEYQRLQEAFAPVFKWLHDLVSLYFYDFYDFLIQAYYFKLQQLLPDNYKILSEYVDILPCKEPSPVYPFAGFVVNLNVATRIHRD